MLARNFVEKTHYVNKRILWRAKGHLAKPEVIRTMWDKMVCLLVLKTGRASPDPLTRKDIGMKNILTQILKIKLTVRDYVIKHYLE